MIVGEGESITQDMLETLESEKPEDLIMEMHEVYETLKTLMREYDFEMQTLQTQHKTEVGVYEKRRYRARPRCDSTG